MTSIITKGLDSNHRLLLSKELRAMLNLKEDDRVELLSSNTPGELIIRKHGSDVKFDDKNELKPELGISDSLEKLNTNIERLITLLEK